METSRFWINLLAGLLLSQMCVRSSVAFPPKLYENRLAPQRAQVAKLEAAAEGLEPVNTVTVTCHPDSLEIRIKADLFGVGAPVNGEELRLGVEPGLDFCRPSAASGDEYVILVGLLDCGTRHWVTEDSLVYTNLLIYAPEASPEGLIRMDEAVVPVECHYDRKYSLSSLSLAPTWIPFTSTQAAVETLDFGLRIMTSDWLYARSSNVFHLGDAIGIEASVRVGHHAGLRVFLSSCVATLDPDMHSVPRYVFIQDGCLTDSQLPGAKSHFLPRTQDDKLRLVIDAFRFHNEDRGELYITCHLNAVPVNDAQAPNKACTFLNGRWRSADGNDYLCGHCQNGNEVRQSHSKPSSPAKFSPRGFGNPAEAPEASWRSGLRTNKVWEKEERVGPVLVLPGMQKSGPLPSEEIPPVLNKISRLGLYGSQWRGGLNRAEQDVGPGSPSLDQKTEQNEALETETDLEDDYEDGEENWTPDTPVTPKETELSGNGTDAVPTPSSTDVTTLSDSDRSETSDPKR